MEYYKTFSNCLITIGYNKSIITDVQRKDIFYLPKVYGEFLLENSCWTKDDLYKNLSSLSIEEVDFFLEFLIDNDLIFKTDTPNWFPKLNLNYEYPFEVSNAIIDIDHNTDYDLEKVINELDTLNCKYLEIRIYNKVSISYISSIINLIDTLESIITSIIISVNINSDKKNYINLIKSHSRIRLIQLFSAPAEEVLSLGNDIGNVIMSSKSMLSNQCCGVISENCFLPDLKLYAESQHHNSCLNKKIAIDSKGMIKNCPSMEQGFGHIKSMNLKEALFNKEFKKYWNISKDKINVCRDCEFRNICIDCRAYIEDPEDIFSKPLKCGYDPYTNEWSDWKINPLKQRAKEFYGLKTEENL